jgi:DNA-binding transcriptional MerR regulator
MCYLNGPNRHALCSEMKVKLKLKKPLPINKERDFSGFAMNQEENDLFSIRQVSERLGVPKHTLRFWEKELNGFIVPQRTRGGQRRYTPANVAILGEIKGQRDNGVNLAEIMKNIRQGRDGEFYSSNKIDLLASRVAEVVKTEVYNFFRTEKDEP